MLVIRHNKREEKREQMQLGYTDTIEYIQMNNYVKAQEQCEDARKLAEELKDRKMQEELGDYLKLIEAVLDAEELLDKEQFTDAQEAFKEAANRARYVDNLGLDYINKRLELTADYISIYDLIYLGDNLAMNLQYDKAEDKYLEAKALSVKIYFDEGRTAALDALEKLYENQKTALEEENEERKAQLTQEEAGTNYIAQGDAAFAVGDYESAKVFYTSALQKYEQLGDETQQTAVSEKLDITEGKIEEKNKLAAEAEGYMTQASAAMDAGDYNSARKYYLLAKDVYATLKDDDKLDEISRKIEMLDMKGSTPMTGQPIVQ